MLRATWKSLWARKIRLLLSTFAIVLGVAFVAGSLVFTATLDKAFQSIMTGSVSDVTVRPQGAGERASTPNEKTVPESAVADVRDVPGVVRVEPTISSYGTYVLDRDDKVVRSPGAPGVGISFHTAPAAHGTPGLRVSDGRAPQRAGEVAIDPRTAERAGYSVGDKVAIVTSGESPRVAAKLVGIADYSSGSGLANSSLVMWDRSTARDLYLDKPGYTDLWVVTDQKRPQHAISAAIEKSLPSSMTAVTGDERAAEVDDEIKDALSFITTFLLIFAGLALVVGSFLIVNTFSILVAQRSRELALLRALGASRGQVTRSVLLEALVVGLLGSTVGLGIGVLLARGIKGGFARFGLDLTRTPLQVTGTAVVAAFAVGLLVTLTAAYLPARRAAAVAPVAALRDEVALSEPTAVRRAVLGCLFMAGGASAELWILSGRRPHETPILGLGFLLVVLGAVLACPLLARPVTFALGAVFRPVFGVVGRMARQNAERQPRRTAATASALMIGLALVSMMSVFGASASRSIDTLIDKSLDGDYVVSSGDGRSFSPSIADRVEKVDGVSEVARVRLAFGSINGHARNAFGAVDPAELVASTTISATKGSLTKFAHGGAVVNESKAQELGVRPGQQLRIRAAGRTVKLPVAAIVEDTRALPATMIPLEVFADAGGPQRDSLLFLTRSPGADPATVRADLDAVVSDVPTVSLKDQDEYKAEQREPIDRLLMLIYALLGLAVIIAILGIVNTLALSVIERTREIGLLRAVGLSRRQLRRLVRLEAIMIAVVGAGLGVLIGIAFGVVLQRSQRTNGVAILQVPWPQLGVFVVLAAVVGVLAAWFPARRAARLDVLKAIGSD